MAGGRPPTETAKIDAKEMDKLMALFPSCQEVCDWFDVKPKTIERFIRKTYGCSFDELRGKRFVRTKVAIKRAQIEKALKGDNTMLIWCGKQYLGQSDQAHIVEESKQSVDVTYCAEWGGTEENATPGLNSE